MALTHLFSHFGRTHSRVQYAIGDPLIAKDVSDKAPAVCLYTPFILQRASTDSSC
ncbi:MAG: hypothetical protein JO284_09175 [Planctomycetaceae bacterium]|nr:hypothetical protein [Planctomycetaceae bacterium]